MLPLCAVVCEREGRMVQKRVVGRSAPSPEGFVAKVAGSDKASSWCRSHGSAQSSAAGWSLATSPSLGRENSHPWTAKQGLTTERVQLTSTGNMHPDMRICVNPSRCELSQCSLGFAVQTEKIDTLCAFTNVFVRKMS